MQTLMQRVPLLARSTSTARSVALFHDNPYTAKFKVKPAATFEKQSTGLTALNVCENPHHELDVVYERLLDVLKLMPADSLYRRNTETLVNTRWALVKQESDIKSLEQKIGMGQIEEVLEQAEYELSTAKDMLKYKVWLPLTDQPPPKQWTWPI